MTPRELREAALVERRRIVDLEAQGDHLGAARTAGIVAALEVEADRLDNLVQPVPTEEDSP